VKTLFKAFILVILYIFSLNYGQTPDSMKVLTNYSLFSEYQKNKDCESAVPYGWKVLQADPQKFSKWIFYKMEDCLWKLHDSTSTDPELKKSVQDTIIHFYNLAIKYRPEDKGYFEARKAYVSELWLSLPADTVISEYELAIKWQPTISTFYYDQLGQLFKKNDNGDNGYKLKALDIYNTLSDREPDNELWNNRKKELVDNIDELLKIVKAAWEKDKTNPKKAKELAGVAIQASVFKDAIAPLEFLVSQEPDNVGYLTQLASCYQKTDDLNNAEKAYQKIISMQPNNKDNYFNLGIIYKDMGRYAQARSEFITASEKGGNWALPIYYEGYLYEQAASNCTDFDRKVVYLLAYNTYKKALSMDGSLSQARDRVSALSGVIPTKEDYFFRNLKSGQTIPITCVGWISRSVTVP
jgi:tetratricopeptide (TPR) repeat protein